MLALAGQTLSLPLAWFVKPLRAAIAAVIRPPTASTRRRQRVIEMPSPMAAFARFILPFNNEELSGLEWLDAAKTQLKPTKEGSGFNEYLYHVRGPSQLNKLLEMEMWDPKIAGTRWRRGFGAQRLYLSQVAGQRGRTSMLVSSACGNMSIRFREYPDKMGMIRLVFGVMTIDSKNHILWNQSYEAQTKAALRNMITSGVRKMALDTEYPTPGVQMVASTTSGQQTDSVWAPPTRAEQAQALTLRVQALTLRADDGEDFT